MNEHRFDLLLQLKQTNDSILSNARVAVIVTDM